MAQLSLFRRDFTSLNIPSFCQVLIRGLSPFEILLEGWILEGLGAKAVDNTTWAKLA